MHPEIIKCITEQLGDVIATALFMVVFVIDQDAA